MEIRFCNIDFPGLRPKPVDSRINSRIDFRAGISNRLCLFAGLLLFSLNPAYAQGEHARRAASELLVIQGDLRKLQSPETPEHIVSGLRERINGGIVPLDILLRLADQEARQPIKPRLGLVERMLDALSTNDLVSLDTDIKALVAEYPLRLPRIAVNSTDEYLSLHQSLCQGCHSGTLGMMERPAYNLFEQSQQLSPLEMFARLLVGVRGDRVTGIDNPLNDLQLTGLLTLYRAGP